MTRYDERSRCHWLLPALGWELVLSLSLSIFRFSVFAALVIPMMAVPHQLTCDAYLTSHLLVPLLDNR